jgi:hypothetical protein
VAASTRTSRTTPPSHRRRWRARLTRGVHELRVGAMKLNDSYAEDYQIHARTSFMAPARDPPQVEG